MTFSFHAFRFEFRALEPVRFEAGLAANAFRGAFGRILKGLACRPECPGAKTCAGRHTCAYARLFEPDWPHGPSGFADAPRPFVIRAAALDGRRFSPGESFPIDIHVFDLGVSLVEYLVRAFLQLAADGIGAGRGKVALRRVHALTADRQLGFCLYEQPGGEPMAMAAPIALSLESDPAPRNGITLRFVTPTELKSGGRVLADAPFDAVFGRARDRISAIAALYGGGPPALDFRELSRRASAIRTVGSGLRWVAGQRRSGRTGLVHPLSGFVGEVRYAGDVAEFLPILRAAYWTGIGRQTVWGKGMVETIPASPADAPIAPPTYRG